MSGTFVETNFILYVHAPYGAAGEESFLLVYIRKISAAHRRSHTAWLFGAPTRTINGRGRRTPNSISHHLEHGSHFCSVICDLCSMVSVGGAWLGMATPQPVEIVAGVCRSCRVQIVLWANNPLYFQEREKAAKTVLTKTNDTARDASLC